MRFGWCKFVKNEQNLSDLLKKNEFHNVHESKLLNITQISQLYPQLTYTVSLNTFIYSYGINMHEIYEKLVKHLKTAVPSIRLSFFALSLNICTLSDTHSQCESNGYIFVVNEWKLTQLFHKY